MSGYIRRLVSGKKARFKDHSLNLELDLVYVTDQVIIMGYPASGIEGLYRNHRDDAKRFLEHRHGKNYWVFNFCPIKENSYDAQVFEGRVSRYPFPDHHPPPLAFMSLISREMNAWLSGALNRVAVLHCKAGKGRSGTMACAYILSLDGNPTPPQLRSIHSAKDWAKERIETTIDSLPEELIQSTRPKSLAALHAAVEDSTLSDIFYIESGLQLTPPFRNMEHSFTDALKGVLDLYTARRMKPPSGKDSTVKEGVSIPSQRRFLFYWALILAHDALENMWSAQPSRLELVPRTWERNKAKSPQVKLSQIKLRMHAMSSVKLSIIRAANAVMEKTKEFTASGTNKEPKKSSTSRIWVSLARYDDKLVDYSQEISTRDTDGHMGERRPLSESNIPTEDTLNDGKWDKAKMVKRFARVSLARRADEEMILDEKEEKVIVHSLRPLSHRRSEGLKVNLDQHKECKDNIQRHPRASHDARNLPVSGPNSLEDIASVDETETFHESNQVLALDAKREVRMKVYMGKTFMFWFWFIPAFHMPQPQPLFAKNPSSPFSSQSSKAKLKLSRNDLDFPLGIGTAIIDIEIEMEWINC